MQKVSITSLKPTKFRLLLFIPALVTILLSIIGELLYGLGHIGFFTEFYFRGITIDMVLPTIIYGVLIFPIYFLVFTMFPFMISYVVLFSIYSYLLSCFLERMYHRNPKILFIYYTISYGLLILFALLAYLSRFELL